MWVGLPVVGLLLLVGAGLALARSAPAGAPPTAAEAPLGDAFTYQGELVRGDEPVSESCQLAFRLYDAADGGLQVGDPITTTVAVVDGLFTVALDFGAGAFPGEARWLGIAVQCPGDAVFTTFPERQALTAAPYALYAKTAASALAAHRLAQDFVLHSGESVSAGDLVTFMKGEAYGSARRWSDPSLFTTYAYLFRVAALSETDFVIAYRPAFPEHGTVISGTLSGGEVILGSPSVFNPGNTSDIAVAALSETAVVIAFRDSGNSDRGTAIVGTLSGGGWTWSDASVFNAASTGGIAVAALSATDLVVVYTDHGNSGYGSAIHGTYSGGVWSWGNESVFNPAYAYHTRVAALSATDFVVTYRDAGNADQGTAIAGTVQGADINWSSGSIFNPAGTNSIDIAALSATDFVVAYYDYGDSRLGTAIVGTLAGGDFTWGSPSVFNPGNTTSIAVAALSETAWVVAYQDVDNDDQGTAITGELVDGGLIWSREGVFHPARASGTGVAALPAAGFVVVYQDVATSNDNLVRVPDRMERRPIGIAQHTAAGGETVTVVIDGVSAAHSGLIPGQVYYWQGDGSLGITPTRERVGLSLSASELLLDHLWPQ